MWRADEAQLACLDFKVFSQGQFMVLLWHFPWIKLPYHSEGLSAQEQSCAGVATVVHTGEHTVQCVQRLGLLGMAGVVAVTTGPWQDLGTKLVHVQVSHRCAACDTAGMWGKNSWGGTQSPTCFWSVLAKEKAPVGEEAGWVSWRHPRNQFRQAISSKQIIF